MRTILNRLSSGLLSLALLVTLTFFVAHLSPGGPAYSILGLKATPVSIDAVNMKLGLDVPLWRQFATWWLHLLRGDLGYSYLMNQPVGGLISTYEANTLSISIAAILLSTALTIAIGLVQGVHAAGWIGRAIGGLQLAVYALPSFFIATVLVLGFSVAWPVLPASGVASIRLEHPGAWDVIRHAVLPVATITIFTTAGLSRFFGQAVQEELGKEYVRTAAAKGVPPMRILFGHVLRNALRPLVTILGLSFPAIFAGGVVVETVFGYPGLGWLLWRSALSHDYPVLIAIVLLIGVFTILGNLAADLVNTALDPRARYE